jgi:hypothetical protein
MVNCPICGIHVDYKNLRSERPKCDNDHALGSWVFCKNSSEPHPFLSFNKNCPYCASEESGPMKEGAVVKCLHVTDTGKLCEARQYKWMIEGPPCFMNHVDKMKIIQEKA